jgi:hypothetical protein
MIFLFRIFFGSVGGRGFSNLTDFTDRFLTDFTDKFATFPHTDFTDFQPTPNLLTVIRFEMRNKINLVEQVG